MQKNSTGYYTLFVFMSLLAAPVIRFLSIYYVSTVLAVIYVALAAAALAGIAFESLKTKRYGNAFEFKNPFHLDVFSYIASAGFFLNFLTQCVLLYGALGAKIMSLTYIMPIVMSGLTALISSVYFIIVGFSFGDKNYDFREFRLVHLVPMLWAISCVFNLIELSSGFEKSIDSVLKYSMMLMLVCFFYCFALEVDSGGKAKNTTVLFARLFSYLSVLYFIDRLALVLSKKTVLFCGENSVALTGVMLCGFVFFFEKNVLHSFENSKEEL